MPSLITYAIFLLLVAAVAAFGAVFQPGAWYAALEKPFWTPPNLAFPIAWGILYLLIAIAGGRAWRGATPGRRGPAFVVYGLQLGANAAWSWLFFGLHLTLLGLLDILLLLVLIGINTVLFWRLDRVAGALLVPYGLWVLYAATLNGGIIALNP